MIEVKILYQQKILKNIRKKTPNDNAIVVHKIKIELFKENKTQIMVWIFWLLYFRVPFDNDTDIES